MNSPMWQQVDLSSEPGIRAKKILFQVAPEFCLKANADLLECMRSSLKSAIEMKFLNIKFTDLSLGQLDLPGLLDYERAMIRMFHNAEYPFAVDVVKWWQLGLHKEEKSQQNVGPLQMPSDKWIAIIQRELDTTPQPNRTLENIDAAKKLAEIFPKLRTERIEGLDSIITNLLKATASYYLSIIRVMAYLNRFVPLEKAKNYAQEMAKVGGGSYNRYNPSMFSIILSVQHPLCSAELIEEGDGITPNIGVHFSYRNYI